MNAWHISFRDSPETVFRALSMFQEGVHPRDIAHELGVDESDLLDWIVEYGGMDLETITRVRALETDVENLLEEIFQLRRPYLGSAAAVDFDPTRGFRRTEYKRKAKRIRKDPS